MRRHLLITAAALLLASAWASEPGQPLDCSDWVFMKPGFSCVPLIARGRCPQDTVPVRNPCYAGNASAVDNESNLITLEEVWVQDCPSGYGSISQLEIVRYVAGMREVVAYVASRCVTSSRLDLAHWGAVAAGGNLGAATFDSAGGRILVAIRTSCSSSDVSCPADYDGDGTPDQPGDDNELQLMAITGFAPLLGIIQSYEPTAGPLSFTVPAMPEGFPTADYFDTYYGDLATVGDWSQAQPLQCGYPATPPSVGDYLTVADPLPDPAPGTGRYYVTAVTHQGLRRYGRNATNGVLSGRDPAVLPGCSE